MITKLSLENFKAWKRLDAIRMAPLTGFFGANSSGKSSIIQFLLMLKQTAAHSDPQTVLYFGDDRNPESSLVELGSYEEIVFQHDMSLPISWEIEWQNYKLCSAIEADSQGAPIVTTICYEFEGIAYKLSKVQGASEYKLFKNGVEVKVQSVVSTNSINSTPKHFYGFPFNPSPELIHYVLASAFEQNFQSVYYLGPIRESPRRVYSWSGGIPSDVGKMGQRFLDALLASHLRYSPNPNLEECVAYWLKELKLIHDFKLERIAATNLYQAMIQRAPNSVFVPLPDVGFGISQILPVLVLCFYAPEHSTIILEHPELHLHPAVQMGLADVFIDAIKTRHIQIILESHSEHLLNRIQRRMAEEKLVTDDVALYFCDMKEGAATMEELQLNEYGEIANYPPDFFGNQFEEVAKTQLEALRRRTRLFSTPPTRIGGTAARRSQDTYL